MVSENLVGFMRKSFGDRSLKILNEMHQRVGVEDIEDASIEDKKNFIMEMQPVLKKNNIRSTELALSELMRILKVNIYEPGNSYMGLSRSDKSMIMDFITNNGKSKVSRSIREMESLINIYLDNTKMALDKGITEQKILKKTSRGLEGLRNNIIGMSKEIEQNFSVNLNLPFIQKRIRDLEERGNFLDKEKIREHTQLARSIRNYNERINDIFNEYRGTFLDCLKKKLYLEKQDIPAEHMVKKARKASEEFYSRLNEIHSELIEKLS